MADATDIMEVTHNLKKLLEFLKMDMSNHFWFAFPLYLLVGYLTLHRGPDLGFLPSYNSEIISTE